MRLIANVTSVVSLYKRLMLYEDKHGCYMFMFDSLQDGPCIADSWFETLASAKEVCLAVYGITDADWSIIPDPIPGSQHDIVGTR